MTQTLDAATTSISAAVSTTSDYNIKTIPDVVEEGEEKEDEENDSFSCVRCQKSATYMCSSCGLQGPRYCSTECQTLHWKTGHRSVCQSNKLRESQQFAASTSSNPFQDPDGTNIALADMRPSSAAEENDNDTTAEEFADNLKFYMQQIYLIIKPVVVCIVLSIFWVKVGFNDQSDYSPTRPTYDVLAPSSPSSGGSGSSSGGLTSFANAAIIIGQIIVVTIIIVFLFRKGWMKVLIGFFMIVVLVLLGFMTYLLILNLIQIFYIPLDYITLCIALWNFVVVGLVSIFWKGPLWLQQAYLTVLSSLMAFSLTGLEQWTTWILLGLLAIWDLVAVLCPFGPLRLLIESSRTQQREVPALLYSVNAVWFMLASPNHFHVSHQFAESSDDKHRRLRGNTNASIQSFGSLDQISITSSTHPIQQQPQGRNSHAIPTKNTESVSRRPRSSHEDALPLQDLSQATLRASSPSISLATTTTEVDVRQRSNSQHDEQLPSLPNNTADIETVDEEDAERSGLKLGLGDFVFYSVLVARAAMYDWITTICCTIAVLTGLTATIFLLAIYKKALPALPISIAFGMLFYFVAKAVLVPYIATVCVLGMVGI